MIKNLGVLISKRVFQLSLAFWVYQKLKLFVNNLTVSEDFVLAAF